MSETDIQFCANVLHVGSYVAEETESLNATRHKSSALWHIGINLTLVYQTPQCFCHFDTVLCGTIHVIEHHALTQVHLF